MKPTLFARRSRTRSRQLPFRPSLDRFTSSVVLLSSPVSLLGDWSRYTVLSGASGSPRRLPRAGWAMCTSTVDVGEALPVQPDSRMPDVTAGPGYSGIAVFVALVPVHAG